MWPTSQGSARPKSSTLASCAPLTFTRSGWDPFRPACTPLAAAVATLPLTPGPLCCLPLCPCIRNCQAEWFRRHQTLRDGCQGVERLQTACHRGLAPTTTRARGTRDIRAPHANVCCLPLQPCTSRCQTEALDASLSEHRLLLTPAPAYCLALCHYTRQCWGAGNLIIVCTVCACCLLSCPCHHEPQAAGSCMQSNRRCTSPSLGRSTFVTSHCNTGSTSTHPATPKCTAPETPCNSCKRYMSDATRTSALRSDKRS